MARKGGGRDKGTGRCNGVRGAWLKAGLLECTAEHMVATGGLHEVFTPYTTRNVLRCVRRSNHVSGW